MNTSALLSYWYAASFIPCSKLGTPQPMPVLVLLLALLVRIMMQDFLEYRSIGVQAIDYKISMEKKGLGNYFDML